MDKVRPPCWGIKETLVYSLNRLTEEVEKFFLVHVIHSQTLSKVGASRKRWLQTPALHPSLGKLSIRLNVRLLALGPMHRCYTFPQGEGLIPDKVLKVWLVHSTFVLYR